jgi:voltage-gated potassium channel
VIALGDDKDNLFVVLSARGLNQNVRIISQAIEKNTVIKLQKAGANEVVLTDAIGGMRIASATLRPTVVSFLDSMLKETEETLRIEEIQVTEKSDLVNKTIIESDISRRTGLLIVAIKNKRTGKYIHNPPGNYKFNSGDVLIVIGTPQQLKEQNSY